MATEAAEIGVADAGEIEVTPEMIEAGEDALTSVLGSLGGSLSAAAMVKRVFLAMLAVREQERYL